MKYNASTNPSPPATAVQTNPNVGTPLEDVSDPVVLRGLVSFLYERLDDIDTADDVAKSDDQHYRKIVQNSQSRKSERLVSDGQSLFLPPNYFASSRRRMAEEFWDKRPGSVYQTYLANVSMLLHDKANRALDFTDIGSCNAVAGQILHLIFES